MAASRIGLRARLLLTSMLVLVLGLGLTGWVLDRSFTASVVAGAQEQLKLVTYSLLGAAEENGGSLTFPVRAARTATTAAGFGPLRDSQRCVGEGDLAFAITATRRRVAQPIACAANRSGVAAGDVPVSR